MTRPPITIGTSLLLLLASAGCRVDQGGLGMGARVDGGVDGGCGPEVCNARDDDCDGMIDEEFDLDIDLDNCGTCGRVCPGDVEHAGLVACTAGECTARCDAGWDDCNGAIEDGCEADLSTPTTCGSCGLRCTDMPICSVVDGVGECRLDCPGGLTQCGMSCVDLETSPRHCGGCGVVCPVVGGSAPVCVAGGCGFECDEGAGDCDGDPTTGCEQPLDTAAHCGACGVACARDHAVPSCAGRTCGVGACDPGWGDCNATDADGCETPLDTADDCGACDRTCGDPMLPVCSSGGACVSGCDPGETRCGATCAITDSDPRHCGRCGNACEDLDHATGVCVGGDCGFRCNPGFGDCDLDGSTGCEADLTSPATCGASCTSCPGRPNAISTCDGMRCGFRCMGGFRDCDSMEANGCETNIGRPETCGACDKSCVGALANATAACETGDCVIGRCDDGFRSCDGDDSTGCEVDITSDVAHCGDCDAPCAADEACVDAVCERDLAIVQVDAGARHACALFSDGAIWCWGHDDAGQIGEGAGDVTDMGAFEVATMPAATQISAGRDHTCAVTTAGEVYCWGSNAELQLGRPAGTARRDTPTMVSGVANAVQVAAADEHTCARLVDGSVVCWGNNAKGQLGDDTTASRETPAAAMITAVSDIDANGEHTCAVSGGGVFCWGAGAEGRLGDGDTNDRLVPVRAGSITTAVEVSCAADATCTRLSGGGLRCWGHNDRKQLGDPAAGGNAASPVTVTGISDATGLSCGDKHACALRASGAVACWGRDNHGQLGDGGAAGGDRATPMDVTMLTEATGISCGVEFCCASRADGVYCWGNSANGRLGQDLMGDFDEPLAVPALPISPPP